MGEYTFYTFLMAPEAFWFNTITFPKALGLISGDNFSAIPHLLSQIVLFVRSWLGEEAGLYKLLLGFVGGPQIDIALNTPFWNFWYTSTLFKLIGSLIMLFFKSFIT